MRTDDDLHTPMLVVVGVISVVFVFALVVAVQALFLKVQDDENTRKYVSQPAAEAAALKLDQQETLNSYRIIDGKKGIVGIPIDVAMARFARECASKPDCARKSK